MSATWKSKPPARTGVYEAREAGEPGYWYRYWDGRIWGQKGATVAEAVQYQHMRGEQNIQWRKRMEDEK